MNNNNLFNSNFFQQTPQKNQGWTPQPAGSQIGASAPVAGQAAFGGMNSFAQPGSQFGKPSSFGTGSGQAPFGTATGVFGGNQLNTGLVPTSSFPTAANPAGSFAQPGQFSASPWNTAPPSAAWQMGNKGSKIHSFTTTRFKEDNGIFSDIQDITAMKEYENKTIDDIRKEDYEMARKPSANPLNPNVFSQPATGLSGNTNFMNPASTNPLGSSTLSGGTMPGSTLGSSSFGSTFKGFGTAPSPAFGATPSAPAFGTTSSVPAFGTMPSAPAFGTAPSPAFGTSSAFRPTLGTSSFGTTNSAPNFGSNIFSTAPATGNTNPMNAFGSAQPSNSSIITQQPLTSGISSGMSFNPSSGAGSSSNIFSNPFGVNAPSQGSVQNQVANNPFRQETNAPSAGMGGGQSAGSSAGISISGTNPFGTRPVANPFGAVTGNSNAFGNNNIFGNSNAFGNSSGINFMGGQPAGNVLCSQQPAFNPPVEFTDPYLIKGLQFEKTEAQKPSVRSILPTPIFSTKKDAPVETFSLRPPKKVSVRGITTIPDIADGGKNIKGLIAEFEGVGKIEYLEPVTVGSIEELERKIRFRNENVEISDEPGTGLNKRARVSIDGMFPYSRSSNAYIRGRATTWPNRGVQERFVYQLKNDPTKLFVDYDVDTGVYVYEVNHF